MKHSKDCDGSFVDCTDYGGYDPIDTCKQTCMQPTEDSDDDVEEYHHNTTKEEVDLNTKHIIHNNER